MSTNTTRQFDLVVFDWDGTLIDSTGAITEAIRSSAADLGLPVPSRERASHVIGLGLLEAVHYAVPAIARAQIPAFVERYRHHFLRADPDLVPFEGVESLLAELHTGGAALAIATGKSRVGLDRALRSTGWGPRFRATRCADEGAPKPDPWMLNDICLELEVSPARTLMIGDTTHDLRMAASAGAGAVAVTYGAHPDDELVALGPLAMASSVAELRGWLLPRLGFEAAGGARAPAA
ncbi:MAG TPA: HAD-IA family hydrolase [Burkholderiaceae bacterium]